MGTQVSTILPTGRDESADVVRGVFAEWDRRLSRFRPDSELSALNAAAGQTVAVSSLLFRVTWAALEAAAATDGLFDPAMLDQLAAAGYDRTFAELPADRPADPGPARPGGAWRGIRLDVHHRTVDLPAGAHLDFGGIAKGMAVDESLRGLAELEVTPALVEAGGDLAVVGCPAGLPAWPVGIEIDGGLRTVGLPHGALATSSVSRRHWRTGGLEQHHLLDPRTVLPARSGVRSASVAAASCRQAEVAAKVALILGPDAGPAFLDRNGLTGLLVLDDGRELPVGAWTWSAPPGDEVRGAGSATSPGATVVAGRAPMPEAGRAAGAGR